MIVEAFISEPRYCRVECSNKVFDLLSCTCHGTVAFETLTEKLESEIGPELRYHDAYLSYYFRLRQLIFCRDRAAVILGLMGAALAGKVAPYVPTYLSYDSRAVHWQDARSSINQHSR